MSSLPERYEKRCLNCETLIHGRYCQVCGQENSNHHLGFWQLVKHFIYDIFHFEGKFWHTFKNLLLRPGLVSKEYAEGKRARYVDPIKLYIFTSTVFFLFFFTFFTSGKVTETSPPGTTAINTGAVAQGQKGSEFLTVDDSATILGVTLSRYRSFEHYDSVRKSSPTPHKLGFFKKMVLKRAFQQRNKFMDNPKAFAQAMKNDFLHQLPKAMFMMLPLFALLLKLLYLRRKDLFYIDHGVFSIHIFVIFFTLFFFMFLLSKLAQMAGAAWIEDFLIVFFLAMLVYLYLAMKKFYGQGRGKTLLKYFLLNIAALVILLILVVVIFFISFINV